MLRIALVGLGHIGGTHVSAIARTDGLRLVAGCDQDSSRASLLPASVPFFTSFEGLVAGCAFDTAVVATPTATHSALAQQVLESGHDVILEKPAAMSEDSFEDVEESARHHRRHIYYAFHAACAPDVRKLQLHLAAHRDVYGPITGFHARFSDPYIDDHHSLVPSAQALGDPWSDSGVNALSVLDMIIPLETLRQVSVYRQGGGTQQGSVVSSVSVGYSFPSGEHVGGGFGLVQTCWDQGVDHKSTSLYFGVSGWKVVAHHSQQLIRATSPSGEVREVSSFGGDRLLNHYLAVFADYRDRVRNKGAMNGVAARRIHSKLFEGIHDQ